MISKIENVLERVLDADIGKLILRVSIAVLLLLHGLKKLTTGIDGIKYLVKSASLPEVLAYGVYVGEVISPIFLILGLYTRFFSLIFASTMAFAIFLAHSNSLFTLSAKSGGLLIELPLLYLISALSLIFLGAGKYSVDYRK